MPGRPEHKSELDSAGFYLPNRKKYLEFSMGRYYELVYADTPNRRFQILGKVVKIEPGHRGAVFTFRDLDGAEWRVEQRIILSAKLRTRQENEDPWTF